MKLPLQDSVCGDKFSRLIVALIAAAAAVIVVGGIRVAAPIATQALIIAFVVIILSPVYDKLVSWKVPPKAAVGLLITAMAATCVYVVGFVLPRGIWEFSRKIVFYHKALAAAAVDFEMWLRVRDVDVPDGLIKSMVSFDSTQVSAAVKSMASMAGSLTMAVVLDVVVVAFLLAELPYLPDAVRRMKFMTSGRWHVLVRFTRDIRHYMAIKTWMSVITGLVIWGGLKFLRIDSPELLGFIAFLFNFVPGIGSVVAAVPGILLALNGGGTATALWVVALYVVANQLVGNIIEPRIMGRGFGVPPAAVLLSVIFWGWVLGPVGMFCAVPLTLAVRGTLAAASHGSEPTH